MEIIRYTCEEDLDFWRKPPNSCNPGKGLILLIRESTNSIVYNSYGFKDRNYDIPITITIPDKKEEE